MSTASNEFSMKIRNPVLRIFNYLLVTVIGLIIISPILIVFFTSFKGSTEYVNSSIFGLPQNIFNFDNYITMFKANLTVAYKNTIILIACSTSGSILMGTMIAYVFSRFEFKFKRFLLWCFLVTSIIPYTVVQVSTFTVIKRLHLFNTIYAGVALYLAASVLSIYIFIQFIEKIPVALDESALVDGASYFRIFGSIIIPQLKPAIATVFIIKTLEIYNDMLTPYLYMPKSSLKTVTTALMQFSYDRDSQWNVMSAGIITVMIPTIILYLYLQKNIISGITEGSVKG